MDKYRVVVKNDDSNRSFLDYTGIQLEKFVPATRTHHERWKFVCYLAKVEDGAAHVAAEQAGDLVEQAKKIAGFKKYSYIYL